MSTRLAVFDLDGTLSDSQRAIVSTFQEVAARHDVALASARVVELIGLPLEVMFSRLMPGRDTPALVAAYRGAYLRHDAEHTRLFEGVPGVLDRLQASGWRLAVATSKRQSGAEASVTRLGIRERFSLVTGDVPERRSKPHPDMLQHVLSTLRVEPSQAVMIGDTTFDLQMAQAAGVAAIGVSWGMHGPERLAPYGPVAQTPEALAALVLGRTAGVVP